MKKKKTKTRKLSIRFKILFPACLLVVAICVALGFTSYKSILKGMTTMGREEAAMAVQVAKDMILADELIAIQPGKESSGTYRMLLQELNEIKDKY
jgi:methyl-accepting chemotaxis protein